MMPLSEISSNVSRSISHGREKAASDNGSASTPSLPTKAVQSMLKTTTELGDLGQFAIRPSRLPRSGSRMQPTRPRSGSFDTSFATAFRHHRPAHVRRPGRHHTPRPVGSSSAMPARNISQSNLSSYTNVSRRKRYAPGPHPYPSQGLNSHGPDPGSRGLYHHRSLVTLRSHGSIPSQSPKMPHGHLGMPTHRASSPAYSDMRSLSHTPVPSFMRAPSIGTIGSSPASMFPRHYGIPGYRTDLSASNASLVRLPSPAVSFNRHSPHLLPVPLRTPTPSFATSHQPQGLMTNNSLGALPRSPTGSTVPQYYDYSESFIEEDCFSPDVIQDNPQPPLSLNQTILENVPSPSLRHAQTPFGTREGSSFHPIELPTNHNRRLSDQSKENLNGVIPKRVSSLGAPALHKTSPEMGKPRRTRSEDSGPGDNSRAKKEARRSSLTSRRSCTPSASSIFFPNAARSSRDLTTLAARVHSPPVGGRQKSREFEASNQFENQNHGTVSGMASNVITKSPRSALPKFSFSPISFEWYSSSPSTRPRTSEATPIRKDPEILSPMPERPMSSQSRKRFSKILEIEDSFDGARGERGPKAYTSFKPPTLKKVDEAPDHRNSAFTDASLGSTESCKNARACEEHGVDTSARISQVTSHDKSTIESLLDKHIECLGLQPETDITSEDTTSLQDREVDNLSNGEDTVRLTDILATLPPLPRGGPMTSSSYQNSSLATLDKQRLRPRRLFASMDARVPTNISERPTTFALSDSDSNSKESRPSYGWQSLTSTSRLLSAQSTVMPSLTSGELADIDSSEQQMKFKVRRRSQLSLSASVSSHLMKSASSVMTEKKGNSSHRRSKSEILARRESQRRRHLRIRLKLKTKSKTVGDLASDGDVVPKTQINANPEVTKISTRQSSIKSPVKGYAELSGESIIPSKTASPRAQSPPIPTRWSSIIAAMPKPVKRGAEVVRKASARTVKSHHSNSSIVEPVNTSRINGPIPRLGSVPRLAPPEFGPPLTSSDLNLSLPYAEIPSTIRPTLRETKSFFSDDSSAQRQRSSIRQKLHLHSLRHVLPGSNGYGNNIHTPSGGRVKPSDALQIKDKRADEDDSTLPGELVGMSDLAYRKRRMLERLKGWWRRQCVSKVRRRGRERTVPGGVGC